MRAAIILLSCLALTLAACGAGEDAVVPTGTDGAAGPSPEATVDEPAAAVPQDEDPAAVATEEADAPVDAGTEFAGAWTSYAEAPVALTEVAAAPFGGAVWTAGGLTADGEATGTVLIYDPTFDTWEEGPALPIPVHHAAMVGTADGLHLLGGYVGSGFDAPTDAVHILDLESGQWSAGPPLPEPRAAGAAAWDGSRVVYGGGVGPDGLASDVFGSTQGGWEHVGELTQAREHLGAASDGSGTVWFLAGRTGGFDTNLAAVDVLDAEGVRLLGELPTPRGGIAGLHLHGVGACAIGGEGTFGTFAEVECMDAEGAISVLPPLEHPRHGLGAAVVEDRAYVVLGGPEPGLFVSAVVEALDIGGGR
jgi:hypothetical protein